MNIPVVLPDLGTTGAPVRLSLWLVEAGEHVTRGDRLLEVVWGAVTFDVAAPVSGTVTARATGHHATVTTGDVLGWIEPDD